MSMKLPGNAMRGLIILAFCFHFLFSCNPIPAIVHVESVIFDRETVSISEGESTVVRVTVLPEDATNKMVTWKSSDDAVVQVADGIITAIHPGTARVSAIADDNGERAICVITVVPRYVAVSSISINTELLELDEGEEYQLTVTVMPEDATETKITWTSDDYGIAKVTNGLVHGIKEGETAIHAIIGEKSVSCRVIVSIPLGQKSIVYTTTDNQPYTPQMEGIISNVYENGQGRIIFDDRVIWLRDYAFKDCTTIETIVLPTALQQVGADAFNNCVELKEITFPKTLKKVESGAFAGCVNLNAVKIDSIEAWAQIEFVSIPSHPFNSSSGGHILIDNTPLTKVVFPEQERVFNYSFYCCCDIESVTFSSFTYYIGELSFAGCNKMREVSFPEQLRSIAYQAFSSCSGLTEITLPNSVNVLGHYAFSGCEGLKYVKLSSGLTTLPLYLFSHCTGLLQVDIPEGITEFKNGVFFGCKSLEEIIIPNSVTQLGPTCFGSCEKLKTVVLGSGVKKLPEGLFLGCCSLSEIVFPETLEMVAATAFMQCVELRAVYSYAVTPPSLLPLAINPNYCYVFDDCKKLQIIYVPKESIEQYKNAFGWKQFADIIKPMSEK